MVSHRSTKDSLLNAGWIQTFQASVQMAGKGSTRTHFVLERKQGTQEASEQTESVPELAERPSFLSPRGRKATSHTHRDQQRRRRYAAEVAIKKAGICLQSKKQGFDKFMGEALQLSQAVTKRVMGCSLPDPLTNQLVQNVRALTSSKELDKTSIVGVLSQGMRPADFGSLAGLKANSVVRLKLKKKGESKQGGDQLRFYPSGVHRSKTTSVEHQLVIDFFTSSNSMVAFIPSGASRNVHFLKVETKEEVYLLFRAHYHTLLRGVSDEEQERVPSDTKFGQALANAKRVTPAPDEAERMLQLLRWEKEAAICEKKKICPPTRPNQEGWTRALLSSPMCELTFWNVLQKGKVRWTKRTFLHPCKQHQEGPKNEAELKKKEHELDAEKAKDQPNQEMVANLARDVDNLKGSNML